MPPTLSQITANFFVDLINRLGVRPAPPDAFLLSNVVQPVSIIDSGIVLSAISTSQTLDTPFSQGAIVNPGAGVLLADTGPQSPGTYQILVTAGLQNLAGGCDFAIERRNAANAANIWSQQGAMNQTGANTFQFSGRLILALNERVRVETVLGGATQTIVVNIWITPA